MPRSHSHAVSYSCSTVIVTKVTPMAVLCKTEHMPEAVWIPRSAVAYRDDLKLTRIDLYPHIMPLTAMTWVLHKEGFI